MTKQEAIEVIERLGVDSRGYPKLKEALDMAIEALSCSEKPNRSEKSTTAEKSQLAEEKSTRILIYLDDAIDIAKQHWYKPDIAKALEELPSAQPELIEKAAYIRGFEQGRTQGMIDAQEGKK